MSPSGYPVHRVRPVWRVRFQWFVNYSARQSDTRRIVHLVTKGVDHWLTSITWSFAECARLSHRPRRDVLMWLRSSAG